MLLLPEEVWRSRQATHELRVDALLAGHLDRAGRAEPHPVHDFLFTYYSFRPAQLRRWHAGLGTALAGSGARERLSWRDQRAITPFAVTLDVEAFLARRGQAVRHVAELLAATAGRPAQLGCFGLHEWAMLYRSPAGQVRHSRYPLRLGPAGTDAVVEGNRIRCSHHDAFRFFTPAARALNALQPARSDQVALEQPGCLHATMDLYKWAYKLAPAVPSELTADCFELACDTRELDMRAAPYDLTALGYRPVRIETPEGKAEYAAGQRALAARAAPLRTRLLSLATTLLTVRCPTWGRPAGRIEPA